MKQYEKIVPGCSANIYSTHQPCLLWALDNSDGDVLELGVGHSSTRLIHEKANCRNILSADDNASWISEFSDLISISHEFINITESAKGWEDFFELASQKSWGLVFVDHGTGEHIWRPTRMAAIRKLIKCSDFIVAHDSDLLPEAKTLGIPFFEYVPTEKPSKTRNGPPTIILSEKRSLPTE